MDIEQAIQTYIHTNSTELDYFMDRLGSDKGPVWHYYSRFYYTVFKPIQEHPVKLFELGVGSTNVDISSNMGAGGKPGASLYAWSKFFKDADIYGADIDKDCLFEHLRRRVRTYYCDQTNRTTIQELWANKDLSGIEFDILIEDGLHEPFANKIFFEESHHKVKVGGVYIIEDINSKHQEYFNDLLENWKTIYPNYKFFFFEVKPETGMNPQDNWIVAAQRVF